MSASVLSRNQFALTVSFHFLVARASHNKLFALARSWIVPEPISIFCHTGPSE